MQNINWRDQLELFTGCVAPNTRMTAELLEFYRSNPAHNIRSRCSSGATMRFVTNAAELAFECRFGDTAREIFSCDISINGKLFSIDSRERQIIPLPDGEKPIVVYLPHLAVIEDFTLQISDNAYIKPLPSPARKLFLCGDSIMQGMTSSSPARALGPITAENLNCTLHNTSVGGAIMRYQTVAETLKLARTGDIFVVGFGINDASRVTPTEEFTMHTEKSLELLSNAAVKAFMVAPMSCFKPAEEHRAVYSSIIRKSVSKYPQVTLIDAAEFFPKDESLLADGLHPNDQGMQVYAAGLTQAIKNAL